MFPNTRPSEAPSMRLLPILVTATAALAASAAPAAAQVPAAPATCPATFSVLHNDHIGTLAVPKGAYTMTVRAPMTCARATKRFASFLQDFDGRLPAPWTIDQPTATFLRGTTGAGFGIARAATPTPAPSGGGTSPEGRRCPGSFTVEHDDRIGALRLPAGPYRITLASSGRPSCAMSARYLARFLDSPAGRLPSPWALNTASGTFTDGTGRGFRIKPVRAI